MSMCRPVFAWAGLLLLLASGLRAEEPAPPPTPDQVLEQLHAGNARFVVDQPLRLHQSLERRRDTAEHGQTPVATVLACSDSRVPVELLFDCGIGDLFVVRVAGQVAQVDETGSVEYGVLHLHTPVLLVLGHSGCGAVTAVATDAHVEGSIPRLVAPIRPAVEAARRANPELTGSALIEKAIEENVRRSMEGLLRRSERLRGEVRAQRVRVVGGVVDLATDQVRWLGPHPREAEILAAEAARKVPAGETGTPGDGK
ncbi:MAG: carbonic anhydrase [Planctomycetes bacterium]|nr:carbonic anhydrase [Planctomycetota bacterium]